MNATRKAFHDAIPSVKKSTVVIRRGKTDIAYGLIVRGDGWVLSKGSELSGDLTVRTADSLEFPAKVVGYYPQHDLGLLKVEAKDLPTTEWLAKDPEPGTMIASVGLAEDPIAVGIVSVPRRSIPRLSGVLGIRLKMSNGPAEIDQVFENGAAEMAGVQVGDVVEQIGDLVVKDRESLVREIRRHQPGDVVALALRRKGDMLALNAQLTHPFGEFMSRVAEQNAMGGELSNRRADFSDAIQHDTVLQANECGGPVVDLDGKVVGLNIARAGRTESYLLPAEVITSVVDDLIAGKYPPPPPIDLNPVIPPPPPLPVQN
jgi:serine protease Do